MTTPHPPSISTIAIRRHIATLMLTLAVIVLGVAALLGLQVELLPAITYPRVGIEITAPGIVPDVAIDEITRPLEQALSSTEGVEQIYSQTREGRVRVDMFFKPGGNLDRALNDATAAFNRARNRLPDTIDEPRIFKFDPSQLPVYEFALTSPVKNDLDLRVFADEELVRELSVVPGVAVVDVSGGVREEVQVNLDLNRLQAQGVGLTEVLNTLANRNIDVSGGRIEGQTSEPLTRTIGRFKDAKEIRDLSFEVAGESAVNNSGVDNNALSSTVNRRVYLRDFAEVIDGSENQRLFVFLNGQPAVKVSIQKQVDANTITVIDAVKRRIESLKQAGLISADITLVTTLDESIFVQNSLNDVINAGISGAVLAAIAVLFFLGSLRQTFIIALTIPLCTLAAVIAMKLSGFSLNVFSLAGLAISIGQAVDTSVVILENINRHVHHPRIESGHGNNGSGDKQAVIREVEQSSREVESAMIASTAANLVSVAPFLLVGGFISLLFNELILTICFAVAASLAVAIAVVPMLSARLLAIRQSSGIQNFWLLRHFNQQFNAATQNYARSLSWVLRHRAVVVLLIFVLFGGSSFWMAGQLRQEILPRISNGQASLFAQFPPGTPLETNLKVMTLVDDIFLKQPETDYAFTTVGGSLFGRNVNANPLRASSTVSLKPGSNVQAYIRKVTKQLNDLSLAGIRLRLSPGQVRGLILNNSPTVRADLDVLLTGSDSRSLQQAGRLILGVLDEQVKLVSFRPEADPRQPEVQIRPDWERANDVGLSARAIGQTVQTAIEGSVPTEIQRGNRLVDVRVQLDKTVVQRPSELARLPLFVNGNQPVRLSDVARIEESQAPGEIQRINQREVFQIVGTLAPPQPGRPAGSLSEALLQVDQVLCKLNLVGDQQRCRQVLKGVTWEAPADLQIPEGVRALPSSIAESNRQLQQSLPILGALAAFLVFVTMAVQYNSLIDPLVIMFTVPLALAGGILGLYVTQTAVGATAIVGAVLLVGIVVNNGIILVEQANQLREEKDIDRYEAILIAAPTRLRPILMTTVTTILGLFPLALGMGEGSEFLQPLGIVVFWGMSLSTLLTLFIVPCFYLLLHDFPQEGDRWQRLSRQTQLALLGLPTRIPSRKR